LKTVENLKRMKEIVLERWIPGQDMPVICPGWRF